LSAHRVVSAVATTVVMVRLPTCLGGPVAHLSLIVHATITTVVMVRLPSCLGAPVAHLSPIVHATITTVAPLTVLLPAITRPSERG
jgi:hypothetical protein